MSLLSKPAQPNQKYTYVDYLTWPQDERWELIDGIAWAKEGGSQAMSPAPSRRHQEVQVQLLTVINVYLQDKSCRVYGAPFDVRLQKNNIPGEPIYTVVQPDLAVICDLTKLDDHGCEGAPNWIIEILSPGSARLDLVKKLSLYEAHQVQEYWIVDPIEETLLVFVLDQSGRYGRPNTYDRDASVPVHIFDGQLEIVMDVIFR